MNTLAPHSARSGSRLPTALVIGFVLAGCGEGTVHGPTIVARHGAETIDSTDLTAALLDMSREEQIEYLLPSGKPVLVNIVLDRRLAAREARRLGMNAAAAASAADSAAAQRALESAYLRQRLADLAPAGEAALRGYYQQHAGELASAERLQVERMFFPDRDAALAARTDLAQGQSFSAYLERAADPRVRVDTLWLAVRAPATDFERVVQALGPGEVSVPLDVVEGSCLARIVERQPGGAPAFEAVRAQLQARLDAQQREQLLTAVRAELRQDIELQIDEQALQRFVCAACSGGS